jgi:amino acid adenylation domain-containing protein
MSSIYSNYQSEAISVDFDPFAEGEVLLTVLATESQKEIWASVQMGSQANCAYNESVSLQLRGELNLKALQLSFQQLVQRHEALRTTFSPDGNNLCITDLSKIDISLPDLSGLSQQEREQQIAKLRQQSVEEPFDLEHGPLFRVQIVRSQPQEHLLILSAHHIICDGWSWAVLINDLGKIYSALKQGTTTELEESDRFSDYAILLEETLNDPETIATEEYWIQQFSGSVPIVDFPTDSPRPPLRTFNSKREDWQISETLVTALKQLGTKFGCSFMTTLLSGFEVFLYRLTGQADLVVGISAAGQAATGNYNLVGHCVNLLPLRTQINSQESFSDYLQKRKTSVLDAYDRQQFTFGSLLQKLALPRDSSRIPLVPIIFNIDQGLDTNTLNFDGLEIEFYSNPRSYENFEIFINATELRGKLTLECQYNTNLFERETICRRLAEFETLLTNIVANPNETIATISLLPEAELQLLEQWNQTEVAYPQNLCIHQLVEAQVAKTPNAIAVIFEDKQITYYQLNEKANRLAAYLVTLGVKPEVKVGICTERSIEMVVGLLGILKAGGAYVPIDPAYPSDRISFLLEDAQVAVLVTQASLTSRLPEHTAKVICLDSDWETIIHSVSSEEAISSIEIKPDNLAYVIYTSGSTGKPKGVLIPHYNAVNLLNSIQQKPGLTAEDVLLAVTTLSFDISVLEIFTPLIVGAQLVVVSREVAADGLRLKQAIDQYKTTFMQATPVTWQLLVAEKGSLKNKLKIISGGEALPQELAKKLLSMDLELWNFYGPTETTVWSTSCQIKKNNRSITIGHPIANTKIYILDPNLQPVPIGVPGELHIGGAGVARGYLDRPELTEQKFIPNPFSLEPESRLYKTGDLAKFLPDGQIECLGRIDYQVKVRGFRIELGEIEALMAQYSAVTEAVAIAREDIPGEKLLVGYFVADTGDLDTASEHIPELRLFLKQRLPDYMVPTQFMVLDAMPLTPNGKVDRKALPKPDNYRADLAANYVAPRNELESQIAEIWAEVLEVERVGIYDNFFELGGYSLLAIQIVSRLRQSLQIEILLPNLFELPTIADLAIRIETLRWAAQSQSSGAEELDEDYEEGEL